METVIKENIPGASKTIHWSDSGQIFQNEDATKIWNELYRMVYLHPLVQSARNAGMLGNNQYGGHSYTDLTQELFLTLLQKGRFQHYVETKMTDCEVEHEISQIELTNMLVAHLQRQHPESYRLARRISTLIQANERFKSQAPSFMDSLYGFYFETPKASQTLYLFAFLSALVYAGIAHFGFGRSEESAAVEAVLVAVMLTVGVPIAYAMGNVHAKVRHVQAMMHNFALMRTAIGIEQVAREVNWKVQELEGEVEMREKVVLTPDDISRLVQIYKEKHAESDPLTDIKILKTQ